MPFRVPPGMQPGFVRILGLIPLLVMVGGCGASVDLRQAIEVTDVTTGWFDAGIVDGKNKLVPTISFRLKNTSDRELGSVQLNAVFRLVGDEQEWSSAFAQGIGSSALPVGDVTEPIVLRASLGYTSDGPRAEMLTHTDFRDVKIELYGKYRSPNWIRLAEYQVERQLLTR